MGVCSPPVFTGYTPPLKYKPVLAMALVECSSREQRASQAHSPMTPTEDLDLHPSICRRGHVSKATHPRGGTDLCAPLPQGAASWSALAEWYYG